jgi:ABC-type oligopeptide transport system substrate-binding subunit
MLAAMSAATTYDELRDASRALDRLVMAGHYQVPQLYAPWYSVSYWNKFGLPKVTPKYYTIDESSDWPAWAVTAWWSKEAERRQAGAKTASR